jgi:hypothetical protein
VTAILLPNGKQQYFTTAGLPAVGYKIATFDAGTSNPRVTWQDALKVAQNANPVILDGRGEASIFWEGAYKVQLQDSTGAVIWTQDNLQSQPGFSAALVPATNNAVDFGTTALTWRNGYFGTNVLLGPNNAPAYDSATGNIGYYARTALESAAIAAGNIAPTNLSYPPGNVLRYGADPAGILDCTAAFNAATASNVAYSLFTVLNEIVVPPGQYLINGTVYVRKGQRLHGKYGSSYIVANNAGAGATFQMGWGNPANVPTVDSGGQPPGIDNLFILGGPVTGCVNFTNIAGGVCRDIFFSAPGLAVNITSSNDLQLRGIFIDVHQGGISISGNSINLQISDINFFNGKTDISISGTVSDAQFSNLHHEYNQINCLLFADAAVIRGYKFTDCEYLYNVQYGTFTGTILNRSASAEVLFDSCAFHNMPGYAYQYGTGVGSKIRFADCLFDGAKTVTGYAASTAAGAVSFANETVRLTDCEYRNLPVTPIAYGGTLQSALEIDGGKYSGNLGTSFCTITNSSAASTAIFQNLQGDATQTLVNNQSTVIIKKIIGCTDWFGAIGTSGASHFVLVPYQFSNLYQIGLRANINAGGSANYRKSTMTFAQKDNDFSGTAKSFVNITIPVQGAANLNGVVATVVEFTAVGGTTNIASSNSGNLAISWPNGYTSESIDVQMLQ